MHSVTFINGARASLGLDAPVRPPRAQEERKHALVFPLQGLHDAARAIVPAVGDLIAPLPAELVVLMQARQRTRGRIGIQRAEVLALEDLHDGDQPRDGRLCDVGCGSMER